jgi:hypothetical protein
MKNLTDGEAHAPLGGEQPPLSAHPARPVDGGRPLAGGRVRPRTLHPVTSRDGCETNFLLFLTNLLLIFYSFLKIFFSQLMFKFYFSLMNFVCKNLLLDDLNSFGGY